LLTSSSRSLLLLLLLHGCLPPPLHPLLAPPLRAWCSSVPRSAAGGDTGQ
jgi:hypothetical protein